MKRVCAREVKPFLSRAQAFFLVIKNLIRGPKNFQMVMLQ
ncbi:hypothetical protein GCWU000325_01059 [Alloprevotella tannerae ATCC 51259]|uniref:Uncharacterized protein n=1 Tax=Alloprevotella tannerae ATCC 51259 TaxID=626522 RepID=C9LFS1_9BACT|nr:hypothetical protein GCWU000325_01059 [Alloprevotella tannerae ATCC 51259]